MATVRYSTRIKQNHLARTPDTTRQGIMHIDLRSVVRSQASPRCCRGCRLIAVPRQIGVITQTSKSSSVAKVLPGFDDKDLPWSNKMNSQKDSSQHYAYAANNHICDAQERILASDDRARRN